jgi:hypothetical protein
MESQSPLHTNRVVANGTCESWWACRGLWSANDTDVAIGRHLEQRCLRRSASDSATAWMRPASAGGGP